MSLFKSFALASAALLVAATTYAAPAQAAGSKPSSTKATSTKSSAPKAKSHSAVGTLDKYDSGSNTIVVNTGKGTETLTLTSTTSLRMGATTMTASDLTAHTGQRVKVRYTDTNGQLSAQSVQIEPAASKPQAKAQTSSKPAPKK